MPADRGRSFRLARDEELAAGLARVAAGRAEAALERLREAERGESDAAAAIHGSRKDLKKLRTVLRLLRDELGGKRYRRASVRFREAARALSESRDAEVKLATLEALCERAGGLPDGAVDAWRKILQRDREALAGTPRSAALTAEAAGEIEAGLEEIRGWNLEGSSWKTIGPALTRSYRRGRTAMKAAAGGGEDELHEWRKRAKDLWYELRLLQRAWPGPLEATAEEAHTLGEMLGDHHDLAVLREDLGERNLGLLEAQTLAAAIERRQEELAEGALALGRRLYAEQPKQFERRLRRYWQAWRG
ncbi:MAG TPA: CHAD domain-containing protein [Solirubrobacterales bacterium]|nr:CHAD domain-containing protein [Solirubrobacterales bacterium]